MLCFGETDVKGIDMDLDIFEKFSNLYEIRKLKKGEKVKSFDCGDDDLNDFILHEAPLYRKALLAVTYVIVPRESDNADVVVAFFSLSNDTISISNFSTKTEFNRFRKHRFVNEKRLKVYPAVKIGRLGINRPIQGQGIGSFLLEFIKTYFVEENKTGCRFLTIDAYADAVPFYLKNDFLPLTTEDVDAATRLLYFDLGDMMDDEDADDA